MSLIHWQENWTLGIDVIDAEHQGLVDAINQITTQFSKDTGDMASPDAVSPNLGVSAVPAVRHDNLHAALMAFAAQAREHFKHEENLMRNIGYPDLAGHRSEHALLLAEYIEMARDLERQGIRRLDGETMLALHHWLVGHMVGADRDYADYYFALVGAREAQTENHKVE